MHDVGGGRRKREVQEGSIPPPPFTVGLAFIVFKRRRREPENLKRGYFDGGNQEETKGSSVSRFLDGQTTNPTLISKNPAVRTRLEQGERFTAEEIIQLYRQVVAAICSLIPKGSVSVEVYADAASRAETMLEQAKEMFSWASNAHVKFPMSQEGLRAAERAVQAGMRVNMTLCFSQEQAAAVYAATRGAGKGQVYVSPFIGRLDDRGENGMDVIANIIRMYEKGDGHVEVLTASVRSYDHLLYALKLGSDIITAPYEVLKTWGDRGMTIPGDEYQYDAKALKPIPYGKIDLGRPWQDYDIRHDLTDKGMEKFSAENALILPEKERLHRSWMIPLSRRAQNEETGEPVRSPQYRIVDQCAVEVTQPAALIIFGASGDLVRRKLLPSLYHLYRTGLFGDRFFILGTSRIKMTMEEFRAEMYDAVKAARRSDFDQQS
jgi:transaldolase